MVLAVLAGRAVGCLGVELRITSRALISALAGPFLLQLHRNGSGRPTDQAHHGSDDEWRHFMLQTWRRSAGQPLSARLPASVITMRSILQCPALSVSVTTVASPAKHKHCQHIGGKPMAEHKHMFGGAARIAVEQLECLMPLRTEATFWRQPRF